MTATSKDHRRAAFGVRCHSGWAATIVLAMDRDNVVVVDRRRVELCDPRIVGSKQPFHHAETQPFAQAMAFIDQCGSMTEELSRQAIAELSRSAGNAALKVAGCAVLVTSQRELPALKDILASHALIHTAEGMFYRNAMAAAAERAGLPVVRVRETEALRQASDRSGLAEADVAARTLAIGKAVGPPWTQDQKLATLAAWSLLAVRL